MEFVDSGLSIVRIRSATFSVAGAAASTIPSGAVVTATLDIINPKKLDVTYTITAGGSSALLAVSPAAHPSPSSVTSVSFSFTPALAAERKTLSFTVGKFCAATNRTYAEETVSVACDSVPNPVQAIDMAYNVKNRAFVAFRLPSGATDTDLYQVEIVYTKRGSGGSGTTVTYGVNDSKLTEVATPNILLDSDPANRYFQPSNVDSGAAYDFRVTVIDAAGQRSATVDTTRIDPTVTRTPYFITGTGLHALADAKLDVAVACDTVGATLRWRYAGGAYSASSDNPLTIPINATRTIQAYATKAGLADSAVAEGTFELMCLAPEIVVHGAGTPTPTATITGRTAGATLYWKYSYQDDADAVAVSAPDAASVAVAAAGTPPTAGSFVAWSEKPGWTDSDRTASDGGIKVATPVLGTAGGTHTLTGNLSVPVTCATSGASIYWREAGEATWTLAGAAPATITLTESADIVVVARKAGYVDSDTVAGSYELKCVTPNLSSATSGQTLDVLITGSTALSTLYYDVGGGAVAGSTVTLSNAATVTAWAERAGWTDSDTVSHAYARVAAPILSPASYTGTYGGGATYPITLTSATAGATIRWSHGGGSGTVPSGNSIAIDRDRTVTAYATAPDLVPSADASGSYSFTPLHPTLTTPADSVFGEGSTYAVYWSDQVFDLGGTMTFTVSDNWGHVWSVNTTGATNSASYTVAGSDTSGPCTVSITATNPASGTYASTSAGFIIDAIAPSIDGFTIDGGDPEGAFVSGTFNIAATVSDNLELASFSVAIDGTDYDAVAASGTTLWYTFDLDTTGTPGVGDGAHTLILTATDKAGNVTVSSATINVANI